MKLIGKPSVMKACTTYGLPHKTLMRFVLKLMANLTDSRDGDAMDKIINTWPGLPQPCETCHASCRCPRVLVHRGEGSCPMNPYLGIVMLLRSRPAS